MPDRRLSRIADAIRTELNHILRQDLRDPRLALTSVSEIRLSADARVATVMVSCLSVDPDLRAGSVQALVRAQGLIRHKLAPRLQLRFVPELRFELDRNAEHSMHIAQLLDSLVQPGTENVPDGNEQSEQSTEDNGPGGDSG